LNKATEVKRWPLLYRAPVSRWVKDKMVIIGDAAHPMLPRKSAFSNIQSPFALFSVCVLTARTDQGQGGAQGIEDGIALGIALSGTNSNVVTTAKIPQRLAIFERARRNRASAIQAMSNAGQEQVELIHREVAKYVDVVPSEFQYPLFPC